MSISKNKITNNLCRCKNVIGLFLMMFMLTISSCNSNQNKIINDDEIAFLENSQPEILFGYEAPPNAFTNNQGKYTGLLVDFQKEIENRINYKFKLHHFENWDSLIAYSKNSRNFVIIGIAPSPSRNKYLNFTEPFLSTPYVLITKKESPITSIDDLEFHTYCTVKKYAINEYMDQFYPLFQGYQLENNSDALFSVSNGDFHATIMNQTYATYLIEKEGITNLKIVDKSGYNNKLSAAVSKKDIKLYTIINKAINSIDSETNKNIKSKWVYATKVTSNKETVTFLIGIALVILVALLASFLWMRLLNIKVRNKTASIIKSETKFSNLFENSHDAIYIIQNNRFKLVNSAFERLFGYSKNEILSLEFDILNLISSESKELISQRLKNLDFNNQEVYKYDFVGLNKDQRKLHLEVAISHFDFNGNKAVQGIIRDITEQKQKENELILAKEKAEISEKLKSAFLANMSHEIRTPMNGIIGFADLLNEPDISKENIKTYTDIIIQSGNRMLNTLNDIIAISKIESGQDFVHIQTVELQQKLNSLYKFFKKEGEDKGIAIIFKNKLNTEDFFIETDETKLESIVSNLIKNAIKFTLKGYIEFGYQLNDNHILFFVKDTGSGIPLNRIDAIFNRFEQADIEDKLAREGSGLGLSIAKSYVEMLGGEIWVNSIEGDGSQFYFTHPIIQNKEG